MTDEDKVRILLNKVLDEMEPLQGRIDDLLQQQRRPVTATDDHKRRLEFIKGELSSILASLRQPGPDYVNDHEFEVWLHTLNPVVTDIRKYLDKAMASCCCFQGLTLSLFPHGLKDIEESLRMAAERPCRYRHLLLPTDDAATATDGNGAAAGEDQLVGIKGDKLLRWLQDKNVPTLKAISLVGAAGVGKTALAMEMYSQLRGDYDTAMVVKISQTPDMTERLGRILSEIQQPHENTSQEGLVDQIKEYLQDKRYLVLIDDIWKESDWNDINQAFPQNNRGSRIIVTTSITKVAKAIAGTSNVHRVNPLSQLDSRFLLFRDAFGSEDRCPEQLKQVCELILGRSAGIPLFICAMADWLKNHRDNNDVQNVPPMLDAFVQALSPTYDGLPYKLKLQLMYSTIYPHGHVFEKISFTSILDAEWLCDSGEEGIEQLIERNVITPMDVEEEGCHWQLNYFMHQFLASKSADKGFLCTSGMLTSAEAGGMKPRRLSLHLPYPELTVHLEKMDLYPTCSLAISGALDGIPLVRFIGLMVLDLEGWSFLNDANVLEICDMYLLRYLSLRKTGIRKLPPEIKRLCKLETLDISHTKITELPSQMCELSELRTLDLRRTPVTHLPAQIKKMRQLRHLLFGVNGLEISPSETGTKMPEDIRGLEVMRTLATVDLTEFPASFVQSLGDMVQMDVLVINMSVHQCADEDFQRALLSSIRKWRALTCLTIHCHLGSSMDFLHHLNDETWPGARHLVMFKVTGGRFRRIPEWFHLLGHIASIEITVSILEEGDLSILGKLPSLKSLVLGVHLLPEAIITVDAKGFRMLQRLYVQCRVPWISFQEGAMPFLTRFELIVGGGQADEGNVPCGITNLQSLSEVALRYSRYYAQSPNVRETLEAVKKGVVDHPKMINLLINGINVHDHNQQDDGYVKRNV